MQVVEKTSSLFASPAINEGDLFGYWKAIEQCSATPARWLCKCRCGTVRGVLAVNLRLGRSRSCGCLMQERYAIGPEEAQLRVAERRYRDRAKQTSRPFSLTRTQFRELITGPCTYCHKLPPKRKGRARRQGKGRYLAPLRMHGIDRVDSTQGYVSENCVPCCRHCNASKGRSLLERFADRLWTAELSTANELEQDGMLVVCL